MRSLDELLGAAADADGLTRITFRDPIAAFGDAAIDELEADPVVCEALGEHVLSHYVDAKRSEWDEYRTQVTQWEIDRYLEAY